MLTTSLAENGKHAKGQFTPQSRKRLQFEESIKVLAVLNRDDCAGLLHQREPFSKVDALDLKITAKLAGSAGSEDAPLIDDVGAIRDR
jgi:hypothetical protein